jgi:hypothetical protein
LEDHNSEILLKKKKEEKEAGREDTKRYFVK